MDVQSSRQIGESMMQCISGRKRCWNLFARLDTEIVLSEGHCADMLPDISGLDKQEQIMIQASVGNEAWNKGQHKHKKGGGKGSAY